MVESWMGFGGCIFLDFFSSLGSCGWFLFFERTLIKDSKLFPRMAQKIEAFPVLVLGIKKTAVGLSTGMSSHVVILSL